MSAQLDEIRSAPAWGCRRATQVGEGARRIVAVGKPGNVGSGSNPLEILPMPGEAVEIGGLATPETRADVAKSEDGEAIAAIAKDVPQQRTDDDGPEGSG